MNDKDFVLETMRSTGRGRAEAIHKGAVERTLTDTQIIDEEGFVPDWSPDTDYSQVARHSPVRDRGQVYGLIQPHNAAHYPSTHPAILPAIWRVKHTKDPSKAKPWVAPTSTSDMYFVGECMIWTDGFVYRSRRDTTYSPADYAPDWEKVTDS